MPALARTTQPGFNRCPDLHHLIRANTSQTGATSQSRIRKPTIFAIHRLADTPPLQPLRPNPHSARGTAIHSPSRFRPLEAFGRRPPEHVAPPSAAGIRNPQHNLPYGPFRLTATQALEVAKVAKIAMLRGSKQARDVPELFGAQGVVDATR